MDMFDASIAIPVKHPVYKKTCAILVFYRSRHVASPAAVCYAPDYHKHPAVVEVFASAQRLAPLAVEYDMGMPHWHSVQEAFRQEHALPAARPKDATVGSLARDGLAEAGPNRFRNLRTQAATAVRALKEREAFKRLSAMEAEWEKGEFAGWLKTYTTKWKGTGGTPAKGTDYTYCAWVAVGSLAAIGTMSFIDDLVDESMFGGGYTLYAMVTHFSAVALILFSTPTSPFGQPRNVVGGHLISAVSMCVCVHGAGRGEGRGAERTEAGGRADTVMRTSREAQVRVVYCRGGDLRKMVAYAWWRCRQSCKVACAARRCWRLCSIPIRIFSA